jgi:hypothetical protein
MIGLVAALVILVSGITAALTRDDSTNAATSPGVVSSTRPVSPGSSTSTTSSTFNTLPTTSLSPISTTSTTVRPAVPTPEAAANGLWAAYASANRAAAGRFATTEVVEGLFANEYSGEEGTFQGCAKRDGGDGFDCRYEQASATYTMTAQPDAASSFKIVFIEVVTSAPPASASPSG